MRIADSKEARVGHEFHSDDKAIDAIRWSLQLSITEPLTLAAFLPAVDRRFITATREQKCGADDTVKRKLTCIG